MVWYDATRRRPASFCQPQLLFHVFLLRLRANHRLRREEVGARMCPLRGVLAKSCWIARLQEAGWCSPEDAQQPLAGTVSMTACDDKLPLKVWQKGFRVSLSYLKQSQKRD